LEPIDQQLELYDQLAETSYEENEGPNYFKNALQNLSEGLSLMNNQIKPETKQINANKKRIDDIIARVTRPSRRGTSAIIDENAINAICNENDPEKTLKTSSNLPTVQKSIATPKNGGQYVDSDYRKDTTPSPRNSKIFNKSSFRQGVSSKPNHFRAPLSDFVNGISVNLRNHEEMMRVGGSVAHIPELEVQPIPRFKSINLITEHATQSGIFTTNLPEDEVMQISPIFAPYNPAINLKEPSYGPKREVFKKYEANKPPRKSERIAKKPANLSSIQHNKTPRTLSQILAIPENKKNEKYSERLNLEDHMFKSYEKSPQKIPRPKLQKSPSSKRYLLNAAADLDPNYYRIPRASLHTLQRIEGYEEPPILHLHKIRETSLDPYNPNRSVTPANLKDFSQDLPSGALSKDPKEPVWKVTKRKFSRGESGAVVSSNKMKLKETLNNGVWDRNSKKIANAQLTRQIKSHLFN
jgi:hypothetical protein